MAANRLYTHLWRLMLVACFTVTGLLLASEHHGVIKSGSLPVPGASITATQGDKKVVTTSDETGYYSFPELADGTWTITVESLGFVKDVKEVGVAPDAPSPSVGSEVPDFGGAHVASANGSGAGDGSRSRRSD